LADQKSFEQQKSNLTEREVALRFVPFLKDFYKNRYQSDPGTIQVTLANMSVEGWVADGKVTFRKPDGSAFICTYEATSVDKSEEVKYQRNNRHLTWDCAAAGALLAAVSYLWCYKMRLLWLIHLKGAGNVGFLFGVFMMGFLGCYLALQHWRKYRYIFAIQQFEQYFADEQWVALAEDVFPAPNDPYYLELRNQCIYHGIGLAIVPFEGHVRKIYDPSRLGIYGKDKKMAHWVTRSSFYLNVQEQAASMASRTTNQVPNALVVLWNKLFRPIQYLFFNPIVQRVRATREATHTRRMKGQVFQQWMVLAAMVVITPLFWKIIHFKAEGVADLDRLQHWKGGQNPEDEQGFIIDGAAIPYDGKPPGVPKQYPVASNNEEQPIGEISAASSPSVLKKTTPPKNNPVQGTTPIDPCEQLKKTGWIIQESSLSTKVMAQDRLKILKKSGANGQFAPRTCLANSSEAGYLVWLGPVFSTESAARQSAETYTKKLVGAKLLKDKLFVRRLK
jgi:hypothetical protein